VAGEETQAAGEETQAAGEETQAAGEENHKRPGSTVVNCRQLLSTAAS